MASQLRIAENALQANSQHVNHIKRLLRIFEAIARLPELKLPGYGKEHTRSSSGSPRSPKRNSSDREDQSCCSYSEEDNRRNIIEFIDDVKTLRDSFNEIIKEEEEKTK